MKGPLILEGLLGLLYPPKCPFCGRLLSGEELLCGQCQRELPWLTGAAGRRAVEGTEGCCCVFWYEDRVRDALRGYKFQGRKGRSETFGLLLAQCIRDRGEEVDCVTWPPLSPQRRRRRGYDQAQLLAQVVARELEVPLVECLQKREVPAQSGLTSAEERRANIAGAYSLREGVELTGQRVLLVDDVLTTGATMAECARMLGRAGAKSILGATLARAR